MPLFSLFQSPSPAFRGKPFWAWNGKLEKDALLWQIDQFKAMGMGGFFMHSRTGLQTEYLGKEWFELINTCADYAGSLGMEAWIYDEDRWPSGSAGGLATLDPQFRLRSLRLRLVPPGALLWETVPDEAWVFEGLLGMAPESESPETSHATKQGRQGRQGEPLDVSSCRRLLRGELPGAGLHSLVFTTETTRSHTFYNGNTYLDTLQKRATEEFLRVTHERYRENCGDRLGSSIRGVFTDEPHRGMVMCRRVETRPLEDPEWTTPYTKGLFEAFKTRFGYDLADHLPELFLWRDGRKISPVKWHYMELLQQLFLENWAHPVLHWCREQGLLLTGHVLHEDSLTAQAVPCGSVMRYYEYLDVPGVDVLGLENRNFCIVKQLASAARQLGKPWMLSELYGCTGWQLDFAGHKEIGLWQALYGINVRCHHLSWYSMAGEAKRDYPASIFFQSGWYRHYSQVEDFFSRLHVALHSGKPICQLLVLHPVESFWAQIHVGWATWMQCDATHLQKSEDDFQQLFQWLAGSGFDFDYGDEEFLATLGRVERNASGSPQLRIGRASYQAVLVSGLQTIRSTSLQLLQRFAEAGGPVLFAGDPPSHVDALASPAPTQLAARMRQIPLQRAPLLSAISNCLSVPYRVVSSLPSGTDDLRCQLRHDATGYVLAIVNTSPTQTYPRVDVHFRLPGHVQEWDCNSGERFHQPSTPDLDGIAWSTHVEPLGERIFVIVPEWVPLPTRPSSGPTQELVLEGPFSYQLSEPNVCVLDYAEFRLADGPWEPPLEILQLDEVLRSRLALRQRSGVMLQPWAAQHPLLAVVSPQSQPPAPLQLRFQFDIATLPEDCIDLLIEQPQNFKIHCNGIPIPVPSSPEWLVDPCFKRIPIPKLALHKGLNHIELELAFHADTDLEALYLAGTFGVDLRGSHPALTPLPATLTPEDLCLQGLPFYSGCVSYALHVSKPAENRPAGQRVWIETGRLGAALATFGSGPQEKSVCWPPYRAEITEWVDTQSPLWCHLWLTRRNTFGPLHLTPKEQSHIGPDSFRSKGPAFTKSYQLFPSGLLQPPRLLLERSCSGPGPEALPATHFASHHFESPGTIPNAPFTPPPTDLPL
jgi:hypothetical protein